MQSLFDYYECPPVFVAKLIFIAAALVILFLIWAGLRWLQKYFAPPPPKPLQPAPRADLIAIFDELRRSATTHHRQEYHDALTDAQRRVIEYLAGRKLVDAGPNVGPVPPPKS